MSQTFCSQMPVSGLVVLDLRDTTLGNFVSCEDIRKSCSRLKKTQIWGCKTTLSPPSTVGRPPFFAHPRPISTRPSPPAISAQPNPISTRPFPFSTRSSLISARPPPPPPPISIRPHSSIDSQSPPSFSPSINQSSTPRCRICPSSDSRLKPTSSTTSAVGVFPTNVTSTTDFFPSPPPFPPSAPAAVFPSALPTVVSSVPNNGLSIGLFFCGMFVNWFLAIFCWCLRKRYREKRQRRRDTDRQRQNNDGGNTLYAVLKVMIVGEPDVGKTSLLNCYLNESFNPAEKPSIGFAIKEKMMRIDGNRIKTLFWDTAGQERFRTVTPDMYRGIHGFIIVYDVTNRDSFNKTASWLAMIDAYVSNPNVVKMLIGTKLDKLDTEDRKVTYAEARAFARKFGLYYFELTVVKRSAIDHCFDEFLQNVYETPNLFQLERERQHVFIEKNEASCSTSRV